MLLIRSLTPFLMYSYGTEQRRFPLSVPRPSIARSFHPRHSRIRKGRDLKFCVGHLPPRFRSSVTVPGVTLFVRLPLPPSREQPVPDSQALLTASPFNSGAEPNIRTPLTVPEMSLLPTASSRTFCSIKSVTFRPESLHSAPMWYILPRWLGERNRVLSPHFRPRAPLRRSRKRAVLRY